MASPTLDETVSAASTAVPETAVASSAAESTSNENNNNNDNSNNNDNNIANKKQKQQQSNKDKKKKRREYNPRWKGYTSILLSSLINLSSTSNVQSELTNNFRYGGDNSYMVPMSNYEGTWALNVSFGSVTIAFATLVLLADRTGFGIPNGDDVYNYSTIWDGKLEGYCLLLCVLWWMIGVAYQTQVHGMAYLALNIYCTSWLSLGSCIYTLEQWSASKDILSFRELTGISATLKSWYVLFLSSMVVTGTSINMLVLPYMNSNIDEENDDIEDVPKTQLLIDSTSPASFGIAFGIASTVLSFGFILVHYNLIEFCSEGGWVEISACAAVTVMWIIGTALMTKHGGVGATVVGMPYQYIYVPNTMASTNYGSDLSGATYEYVSQVSNGTNNTSSENCELIYENRTFQCSDFIPYISLQKRVGVPGSNLYLSVWVCLLSSVSIAFRWKAEQALHFAQAQEERAYQETVTAASSTRLGGGAIRNKDDNDDDGDGINNNNANVQRDDEYDDEDNDDDDFLDSESF